MAAPYGRVADSYLPTPEEVDLFRRDGYVHLRGVLTPEEVAELEVDYQRFLSREIPVSGRDFCDMSGKYELPLEEYAMINVMLPRVYHPAWQGNIFERRAASIARALCGPGMELDYDQLLAKCPGREDAVFGWHQDQAYWLETEDPRTATVWLAIDDSTLENGCMRFVPGSNREAQLREHSPLHGDRGESHTLVCGTRSGDQLQPVPIHSGDVTVHDQRVIHGSGGNRSLGWRRAYVVAFRSQETVALERSQGFTHSHEDSSEVLDRVRASGEPTLPPKSPSLD